MTLLGWDIGGVNVKLAVVGDGAVLRTRTMPFELQRAPRELSSRLQELATTALGQQAAHGSIAHAVTMTAELSQMFRTKREGVAFVLDALEAAWPADPVRVFAVDCRFVTPEHARRDPLAVAAANWMATARAAAWSHADALLLDIGTTTSDIVPIVAGEVVASGRTDPERLASSELVYTGVVRTAVESIVHAVPWKGRDTGVSAEGFALTGDVYVWRGDLQPSDYTAPAPDGRPVTRKFAGERLARVICADREMLDEEAVSAIAEAVAAAQRRRLAAAIAEVRRRHPAIGSAVVTGVGAFLGERAAREQGLETRRLVSPEEPSAAVAVALLLARALAARAAEAQPAGWR
jgi:(4-(4-[2-(gamma-L-glutamylamino)ethyl]phenoxymethyl)furan-2-yl)methanamine synthase